MWSVVNNGLPCSGNRMRKSSLMFLRTVITALYLEHRTWDHSYQSSEGGGEQTVSEKAFHEKQKSFFHFVWKFSVSSLIFPFISSIFYWLNKVCFNMICDISFFSLLFFLLSLSLSWSFIYSLIETAIFLMLMPSTILGYREIIMNKSNKSAASIKLIENEYKIHLLKFILCQ